MARFGGVLRAAPAKKSNQPNPIFHRAGDATRKRSATENAAGNYLRAIRTIPNLSLDLGHFLASKVRMMRSDYSGKVEVLKSEEKGSDVNLASRLLIDCYNSKCDIAVIISNDSDLVFPIEHVKRFLGTTVGIVNPHQRPSRELLAIANFYKPIRQSILGSCQFPDKMTDALGAFHKPSTW